LFLPIPCDSDDFFAVAVGLFHLGSSLNKFESNAPAKLRALSEKQASRQLQPVVGRHFSNLLAANMGEIRVATNTKIQILPLAML